MRALLQRSDPKRQFRKINRNETFGAAREPMVPPVPSESFIAVNALE